MKGLYLYTKSEDLVNGPIQEPMAEGEVRVLYVDNERAAIVQAVRSDGISCDDCYLRDLRETTKWCMIPIKHGGSTVVGGVCWAYNKLILKNVEGLLEEL